MPGDRLAISPFTVKSAVANSFAALIGGATVSILEKSDTRNLIQVNTLTQENGNGIESAGLLQNLA